MEKRETISEIQYLKNLERRSFNTAKNHKTTISVWHQYLKSESKINLKKAPLNALSGFVTYLETQSKSPETIIAYLTRIKKYIRLCHGIKLDVDDFRDFVSLPQKVEQELEPLEKSEYKLIIENATTARRRALYWFISSTGVRIAEALQIRKSMIDFDVSPALITMPAKICKGKKMGRFQYLSGENTPLIRSICRKLEDNDFVFTDSKKLINALSNEQHALANLLNSS